VPLDGSDKDQRVIPAAAALADLAGADFHLIRVLEMPAEVLSPRARTMGAADARREQRRETEEGMRAVAARLVAATQRAVTMEIAEGFDAADVLIERISRHDADLVVMATRAPGTIGRAVRGSVADRVMRESTRPVVLVPPGADRGDGRPVRLHRVLLPLDGSPLTAAERLLELKGARDLELVLLEVVGSAELQEWAPAPPALPFEGLADVADARAQAETRVERSAARLRAEGVKHVRTRVVEAAHPAAAITQIAREERADLICLSTRGTSGLKRFVLGSVTAGVVRDSDVPVMLVSPREEGDAARRGA
jgi:nucleotide-binding universal stress UspA family protein